MFFLSEPELSCAYIRVMKVKYWQTNIIAHLSLSPISLKLSNLVLVIRLGGLSMPKNSVVRLTDPTDMTIAVYHGRKATKQ